MDGKDQLGSVKNFNRLKGYGFINPDDGSEAVFVHYSAIVSEGYRKLDEGDPVMYDLTDAGRGPQASNVRPISVEDRD